VGEIRELLQGHTSVAENVTLMFDSADSIAYVVGDEDLIRQVIMNLTINACEAFDGKPGQVLFRLVQDPAQGAVLLLISDNGPGMDAALVEKIYEPFFSTKKSGTGLGLAIVHRICTALKLKLSVDTQPGFGTTFKIQFRSYTAKRQIVRKTVGV
jgi:signal transduction histidine kinase